MFGRRRKELKARLETAEKYILDARRRVERLEERFDNMVGLLTHILKSAQVEEEVLKNRLDAIEADIKGLMENVQLLNSFQEPNCKMRICSKEELAKEKAEVILTPPPEPEPVQCKMSLVKKGQKPIVRQPSLARRIVNYLYRCGKQEWILEQDVKEYLLGDAAVSKGGGHFSRSVVRLQDLGLIDRDGITDSICLTPFGFAQHELCWFTLKDYQKLVEG